jgi:Lsr2
MVKQVTVTSTCDMDPEPPGEGRTVHFALDGTDYEIDLCPGHEQAMGQDLGGYAAAGRRATTAVAASARNRPRSAATRAEFAEIRAWARSEQGQAALGGLAVSPRGRIPAQVMAAWGRHGQPATV